MPENAYIQQAIAVKKQTQQTKSNKTIAINFAMQMQQNIYAKHLEIMRGSLGV